jgi:hypothetical protein
MIKASVLAVLDALENEIQAMRESGETDLRTVLHYVDNAKRLVNALEEK